MWFFINSRHLRKLSLRHAPNLSSPMKAPFSTLVTAAFLAGGAGSYVSAEPTNHEQYMLELINRARANGNTEAVRLGLSNVQAGNPAIFGESWTIQPVAPPLVWSEQLGAAARNQAQLLFNNNFLGGDPHHFGGTTPESRVAAAGFTLCTSCPQTTTASGFRPGIENFGFAGSSTAYTTAQLTTETANIHALLFVDGSTAGRLHRITIMHTWFREIGVGMVSGTIGGQGRIYAMMDFGKASPGTQLFLTGVAYNDTVTVNQFYTPGEGLGGLKVQAWQNETKIAETTTFASGGYRLPLNAGAYQIRLVNAAGAVSGMGAVGLTSENVKLDSRNPAFTNPPAGAVNLRISRSTSTSVLLQWDDPTFSLYSSSTPAGPWTAVGAASPATVAIQGSRRFFRCQK